MDNTEKVMELVDGWMKTQKEFMENWLKSQKAFMANWTEATQRLQESLASMGSTQEGPAKDMFGIYNTWITTIVNSSRVFADEAGKVQETWKNTIEKQMEMSREMVKGFTERTRQAA